MPERRILSRGNGAIRIPKGWTVKALGDLVDPSRPITYGVVKPGEHDPKGVAFIRGGDVQEGQISRKLRTITTRVSQQYRRTQLRGGELIVALVGYPGQSAIVPSRLAGANLARQVGLVAIPDKDMTEFVHQFIQSDIGQSILLHPLAGSAQQVINLHDVRRMAVLIPPPDVRNVITKCARTFDETSHFQRSLIRRKTRRLRGLMQELLTGRKRLRAFAGQPWDKAHIGDLLKVVERHVDWSDDECYRLVSIRRRSGGFFDREKRFGRDILTKTLKTTKTGDFVLARMQVLHGAMATTPAEFNDAHVSDSYITFVPKDAKSLHMPFFGWLSKTKLMYHKTFLASYGVAIEKMTFCLPWFLRETVVLPPSIDEQRAIADVLDTAQREIELLNANRKQIHLLKRGLMQRLLTGQIRVEGVAHG